MTWAGARWSKDVVDASRKRQPPNGDSEKLEQNTGKKTLNRETRCDPLLPNPADDVGRQSGELRKN